MGIYDSTQVTPESGAFFPYVPPVEPYSLPREPFDIVIKKFGLRLGWGKSHTCPCVGFITDHKPAGAPNPSCLTCEGRGIYWDTPLVPFIGLITYGGSVQEQSAPGASVDKRLGNLLHGDPRLTIPFNAGIPWAQASEFDIYVEVDAGMRFNSTLTVGGTQAVPYQQNLVIEPEGAVTIWDQETSMVQSVTGYSVSGAFVTLPSTYPVGTPYVVAFQAAPTYVGFRLDGGFPHVRPFAHGKIQYPKRFRLEPLDMWLRSQGLSNF